MSDAKLGTEHIEALLVSAGKLAKVAKKIAADHKVDSSDLSQLIPLVTELKSIIESIANAPKALDEIKDIDVAEVVALIQKVDSIVEEVEKA